MWTDDADADALLATLVGGQRRVLGRDLVGSYLFGSAATGDFEAGVSDLDTVAVLRSDLSTVQLADLADLHASIVRATPAWDDRVEAVYLSSDALMHYRTPAPAARISPGEPFHPIEVDERWLIDWYRLRAVGIAMHGPPVAEVVPPITWADYVLDLRRHLSDGGWVQPSTSPGDRAYAVFSMCRGLATLRTEAYVSKRDGARWASEAMPEHAALIAQALAWRESAHDPMSTADPISHEEALRFVLAVQRRLSSPT